jgi:hypothetical protein
MVNPKPQKINGGYYIKARCIKESAVAHSPPYVREIWDYLLREANHKDSKYSGFTIKRGQLFRSYRDIRNDLSWKVGYRTERYNENQMKMGMRYLMKQLMITVAKQPRGNVITICNYDYFQNPKSYEATNDTTSEATNAQPMPNQGVPAINKNVKKKKKENNKPYTSEFEKFWKVYPKKKNKDKAFDAWNSMNGQRPSLGILLKVIEGQRKSEEWTKSRGQYIPYPATWLNNKRWEDEENTQDTGDDPPYWSD